MTDSILKRTDAPNIAYTLNPGKRKLCVLYLHGWLSKRKSKKATAISEIAERLGAYYLSLDYTAHGESSGKPADFTVGQAITDTIDVLNAAVKNMPLLIVGNSIGGWIGLALAEKLPQTKAFLGLAPAPDITQFIWDSLLPEMAKMTIKNGITLGPSEETQGFCFTKKLFDDGKEHFMLNRPIRFDGPVHLIKGDQDDRVDEDRLRKIKNNLTSKDVLITLIKGANHHLSEPKDLRVIQTVLRDLVEEIDG